VRPFPRSVVRMLCQLRATQSNPPGEVVENATSWPSESKIKFLLNDVLQLNGRANVWNDNLPCWVVSRNWTRWRIGIITALGRGFGFALATMKLTPTSLLR